MEYGFNQKERVRAARKIQGFWRSHKDRQLFQLMLHTVRAAEHCLAPAVLRQLSPREVDLVRDPSMHCNVRFRFTGSQFPPLIVFKIFQLGRGRQYISGRKVFRPSNEATTDTCRMMGKRTFFNHIIADEIQRQGRKIADTSDITCMRDYMQYSSHLDELPAYLGGRENSWRSLSLQGLSRNFLRWDSLDANGKGTVADRLRQELLLSVPQEGGGITRTLRSPAAPPSSVVSSARHVSVINAVPLLSTRRSARACSNVARMRQLYIQGDILGDEDNEVAEGNCNKGRQDPVENIREKDKEEGFTKPKTATIVVPLVQEEEDCREDSLSDSEWEEEAEKLCLWTKQLALDVIDTVPTTEK